MRPKRKTKKDTTDVNVNADEGANKRSYETAVHTGHKVHPSKVPRVELLSDAHQSSSGASDHSSSSYANMSSSARNHSQSSYDSAYSAPSAQSAKHYRLGSYSYHSQGGDENQFSPLRVTMEYDITHDDQASNNDASPPRQWKIDPRRTYGKGEGKNSRKRKAGKDRIGMGPTA
jgi:hypothetical protein